MYEPILVKENLLYLLVLAIAAIITFLFTPVTRIIAKKTGAVDVPDKERKFHRTPTPRLGGIAIAFGFAVAAICAEIIFKGTVSKEMLITVIGGLVVCGFGIVDDIFNLPALLKFFVQICVAVATVLVGGAIEYTTLFGHTIVFGIWSIPVTILWIVLLINAMNLIDGLDGLACGVSFLSSVALLIIAILMGEPVCAVIAAALCGASIGFLPYNVNPAAVFMGDSGSTMFGYVLACISIFGFFKGATLISSIAPALVFALPVVDVIVTFGDRITGGKNPFKPDRSHLHYKLVDIGFSPKQAVAIIYIASAVFCGAAIFSLYNKMAALIIAGCMFLFLFLLKHVDKLLPGEVKTKNNSEKTSGEQVTSDGNENVETVENAQPSNESKADDEDNSAGKSEPGEEIGDKIKDDVYDGDSSGVKERSEKTAKENKKEEKLRNSSRGEKEADHSDRKDNKKDKKAKDRTAEKAVFAAAISSNDNDDNDESKAEKAEKQTRKKADKSVKESSSEESKEIKTPTAEEMTAEQTEETPVEAETTAEVLESETAETPTAEEMTAEQTEETPIETETTADAVEGEVAAASVDFEKDKKAESI